MTSPTAILELLRRDIAERRADLEALERAEQIFARLAGESGRSVARPRVAAGSLPDRILSLAANPATLAALVDEAGARKGDVVREVKRLCKAGQLTQTGKGRGTRYQAKR